MVKHLDLFSGIGGFALAADRVFGKVEHTFCDNDEFCQLILKKHWQESKIYADIRTLTNTRSKKSNRVSDSSRKKVQETWHLLTGGFPCQPFSQAGRRKGTEDDRYLWPEMFRVIQLYKPTWVIAENVRGLVTWNEGVVLEQVCSDLESEGYEVQPLIIPAVAVNAPHRRDRVWFIAHRRQQQERNQKSGFGGREQSSEATGQRTATGYGFTNKNQTPDWNANWPEVAAEFCRVDDGLPRRLDRNPRLKALGNAIVPQVAEEIFKAIKFASPLLK